MLDRPNIIFMHSHNTGTFIEPYGHAVPTPNMQKLAEDGVLFRRAFATAPTCSPSRASFLTGMYPHTCGMLGLAHRGFSITDYSWHASNVFRANGYFTATAGVEHTAPNLNTIGYDTVLSGSDTNYPKHKNDTDPADAVVRFLKESPRKPFFINMGLNETHRPFHKAHPEKFPSEREQYCIPPRPLPDTPETRSETADFRASARIMDNHYGKVLTTLDESGLNKNTIVFCFSDHGLQFPRNMCNLTDHGSRVYLIIKGIDRFKGRQEINAMVSLMDLLPTAYEAAGIEIPNHVEGMSLCGLLKSERETHREHVFCEVNYHAAYEPMRSIRTDRYKYIRRYDKRSRLVLPNVDDTPTKNFLLDQDWGKLPRDQEMLYDLIFDPDETNNIATRADMTETKRDLTNLLDQWMNDTNDPLLPNGHVNAPKGSKVNNSDDLSPKDTPQLIT